jgi:Spy/CpxP family protein refolding chaperone
MRRLVSALAAFAFAASLSTFAVATQGHNNMMTGGGMMMGHRCPRGQHWVKGYVKKNGQKVKGYCR